MRKAAVVIFETPEGLIFNLKDDSHRHPNAITFFGGAIEDGESAETAIRREIEEETSLDSAHLNIKAFKIYEIDDKIFYVFTAQLPDADFDVFEGAGSYILKSGSDPKALNFPPKTRQIITDYLRTHA